MGKSSQRLIGLLELVALQPPLSHDGSLLQFLAKLPQNTLTDTLTDLCYSDSPKS
jgi:hypothetical protein